jgi:hypothetical protein
LNDYRAWARLGIIREASLESVRRTAVEVLFAFHGIGGEFNGVLVCSGMAYTRLRTEEGTDISGLVPLSKAPFYFGYDEELVSIHDRFDKWIDEAIVEGLDYWRKAIGA